MEKKKKRKPGSVANWSVVGCCEGWSAAGDRELKRRDRMLRRMKRRQRPRVEASRLELKRRRSKQRGRRRLNCCDRKRAKALPVSEASRSRGEALSTFEVKCHNQDQQRRWRCAGFWERMGWVSFGNEEGNDVNDKWNWKIKLSGSFSGL